MRAGGGEGREGDDVHSLSVGDDGSFGREGLLLVERELYLIVCLLGLLVSMVVKFKNIGEVIELYIQGGCIVHNEEGFFDC